MGFNICRYPAKLTAKISPLEDDLPPIVVPSFKLELGSIGDAPFFGPN
jgi:hypothetical protein